MTELIGRADEMAFLLARLEGAESGKGSTVFISGEAGVGKTRLSDELIQHARSKDFEVLTGRCLSESLTPYLPFVEITKAAVAPSKEPRKGAARIKNAIKLAAPNILALIPVVGPVMAVGTSFTIGYHEKKKDSSPEDLRIVRDRMLESYLGLVLAWSSERPVLLFIDDLQWADPSSLALMHYLSRNTRESRVLIVGTYRPEDTLTRYDGKEHQFAARMRTMSREDLLETLELKNLGEDALGGLVLVNLGKVEDEREFVPLLWKETQGNPLFVRELLNLLREQKVLVERDGRWKLTRELKDARIPSMVHDVIARRLERLAREQRQLLEVASVVGDDFSSEVVQKVTGTAKLELLRNLNEIEKLHGLIVSSERKYRFSHVKVKEVLYGGITEELRREYHLLVGDVLSELYGESESVLPEIAYHYHMSKDADKAVPRLKNLIEATRRKYSNDETIRYCKEALGLMADEKWLQSRVSVLETLGDMLELTGVYDEAIDSYRGVLKTEDSVDCAARMHRKIANAMGSKGDYDAALAELALGEGIISTAKTPELGRIIRSKGVICKAKGDYDQALKCYEKSLTIMEQLGDLQGVGMAYSSIGLYFADKGEYDKALEFYIEDSKIREELDDEQGVGIFYHNIGQIAYARGEYDKALDCYEKCLKICEKLGDQQGIGMAYNNIGAIFEDQGALDKAIGYYEKSLKISEKLGHQRDTCVATVNIGLIFFDKGDYGMALECNKKCLAMAEKIGDKRLLTYVLNCLSDSLIKSGDTQDAEKRATRSLELARQTGVKEVEGMSLRTLGMIAAERKGWGIAEERFQGSASILEGAGIKRELGTTYLEYGRMLQSKGDRNQARKVLGKALKVFEELKLPHRKEDVLKEMAKVGQ
jgi:tetratricopeptide (TPR) repeat protein